MRGFQMVRTWVVVALLCWLQGELLTSELEAAVPAQGRPPQASPKPGTIPIHQFHPASQSQVRAVVEQPTLSSTAAPESFTCKPEMYYWLLDHPDIAARLWQCLGARCVDIHHLGNGRFVWKDKLGSRVHWRAVWRTDKQRIWYAEGKVRGGRLLPFVSVRAVAVLDHRRGRDVLGREGIRHQMHLHLQADSTAVSLATRLLGTQAPRLARQYARQLGMFFGAMAWYLERYPQEAVRLFKTIGEPMPVWANTR